MRIDPTKISNVREGMFVELVDLKTNNTVQGKIILVISQSDHPEGIFVKLDNNCKGHTKEIIRTTVETSPANLTNSIELIPESFNLEYKQSFMFIGKTKTEQDAWIPKFNVFKGIAGLANAESGRLVIGVKDEKNKPLEIIGLKNDFKIISEILIRGKNKYSNDQDGMELRIIDEFAHFYPKQPLVKNLIRINFVGKKPEEMVCIIEVHRSTDAVVMYDKNAPEHKRGPNFFVRVGNQTIPYDAVDFLLYWPKHILGISGTKFDAENKQLRDQLMKITEQNHVLMQNLLKINS